MSEKLRLSFTLRSRRLIRRRLYPLRATYDRRGLALQITTS